MYTDTSGELTIGIISGSQFKKSKFNTEFVLSSDQDPFCKDPNDDPISTPHSNSFLDLDGDCMPDLFLTKKASDGTLYFEIYV